MSTDRDRRRDGPGREVALVVIAGIAIVGAGLLGRLSGPVTDPGASQQVAEPSVLAQPTAAPDPAALRRGWERPYAVAPGFETDPSAWLTIGAGWLDLRTELDGPATRSEIVDVDSETIVVSSGSGAFGCAAADIGTYGWAITGTGTWLDLLPTEADDCPARQTALAGSWVVARFATAGAELLPGTHLTQTFDPFGDGERIGQLSFTVPSGWLLVDEAPMSLALLRSEGEGPTETTSSISLFSEPHVTAGWGPGVDCGAILDGAPGLGTGVAELAAAIASKPGIVSTPAAPVTVGGYDGVQFDVEVEASWTGGCMTPGGPIVAVPLLQVGAGSGAGPRAGITPDAPATVVLLDLGSERTMAILVGSVGPGGSGTLAERVAPLMAIVKSFVFHSPGT